MVNDDLNDIFNPQDFKWQITPQVLYEEFKIYHIEIHHLLELIQMIYTK